MKEILNARGVNVILGFTLWGFGFEAFRSLLHSRISLSPLRSEWELSYAERFLIPNSKLSERKRALFLCNLWGVILMLMRSQMCWKLKVEGKRMRMACNTMLSALEPEENGEDEYVCAVMRRKEGEAWCQGVLYL